MQTLTQEIKDQLELYVTGESEEVLLNKFNISAIHQAIHALNYVSVDFLRRHFGHDPFVANIDSGIVLKVNATDQDYIAIKCVNDPLVIYHNAEETVININDTRLPGELGGDTGWIERITPVLIDLVDIINASYVSAIESKLKAL